MIQCTFLMQFFSDILDYQFGSGFMLRLQCMLPFFHKLRAVLQFVCYA